ncbi:MAG: sulfotransferase family 2 domain-containing protein [Elainellaceae cyanobacterium]
MRTNTTDCLILLHIMKTGGTTLARLLEQNVSADQAYFLRGVQSAEDVLTIPEETRNELRLLRAGHAPFGAHKYLSQNSTYVTMLRNPISRVLSLYYFIFFPPNKEPERELMPLKQWVETAVVVENHQTQKMAGLKNDQHSSSREMLEKAKQNFHEHFSVVGITERFDESVMLMHHHLGLNHILYQSKNVNKNRPKKTIDPEIISIVKARNQLDLELYEYANQQLDSQIAEIPSFSEELTLFHELNAQFTAAASASEEKGQLLKRTRHRLKTLRKSREEFKLKLSHAEEKTRRLSARQRLFEKSKLAQLKQLLKVSPFWKKP